MKIKQLGVDVQCGHREPEVLLILGLSTERIVRDDFMKIREKE